MKKIVLALALVACMASSLFTSEAQARRRVVVIRRPVVVVNRPAVIVTTPRVVTIVR